MTIDLGRCVGTDGVEPVLNVAVLSAHVRSTLSRATQNPGEIVIAAEYLPAADRAAVAPSNRWSCRTVEGTVLSAWWTTALVPSAFDNIETGPALSMAIAHHSDDVCLALVFSSLLRRVRTSHEPFGVTTVRSLAGPRGVPHFARVQVPAGHTIDVELWEKPSRVTQHLFAGGVVERWQDRTANVLALRSELRSAASPADPDSLTMLRSSLARQHRYLSFRFIAENEPLVEAAIGDLDETRDQSAVDGSAMSDQR
jgi:hypothetical protein